MSRPYEGPLLAAILSIDETGAIGPIEEDGDVIEVRASADEIGAAISAVVTRFPNVDAFDVTITRPVGGVALRDSAVPNATHPLVSVHQLAFPERYGYDADHMYWSDFDPETDDERAFKREHGVFVWDSETIEWVMAQVEACAAELGVTLAAGDPDAEA